MVINNRYVAVLVAILVGFVVGWIGGLVYVLIPWAIIGLIIGFVSSSKKAALINGAVYGFVLSYVFMVHGYTGKDPLSSKLLPFFAFGIFGAICGLVLALAGRLAHRNS